MAPPDDGNAAPSAPDTGGAPPSAPEAPSSFENLGSADDLDSVEVSADSVVPSAEPAVVADEAASVPPPGQAPAPPQQPPPAAAKPAQAQATEQPQAAPATPAPGQVEPDNSPQGLVKQLEQHRGAVLQALAADRFKLSPEEVSALDTDAVAAIPGVMARVYYEAMQSTLLHIQNMVPQVVMNMIKVQKQNDDVENAFYGQFKALDRMKHHGDVMQFAQMLRGTNPQISQRDLFSMVGAAVMAKHNLTQAMNGIPSRQSQPAPFVPANPGTSVRITPEGDHPFSGLGQDWDA